MRILALIPARGGSKGVKGKNIKLLHGKPLLAYTVEVALKSSKISKILLSSDDDEIIALGKKLGVDAPFKRPAHLASDTTPTLPVILHALEFYEKRGLFFDAVCLLQVTTPFRKVKFLDEAIDTFIQAGSDSLISVQQVPHEYNPHWTFKLNEEGFLKIATGEENIISRRQDLPKAYHRDGSIYITRVEVLKQQQSLYGKTISFLESPKAFFVNIDTMDDWKRAEKIALNWHS